MSTGVTPRLLLVHAHPDDETINNGATMAKYAAAGAAVTLVTCTRGEQGEILVPELAHRGADGEDTLGEYRETELAAAMAELGVTDHRFLGAPEVRYRDSGMAYGPGGEVVPAPDPRPEAFALAGLDEAAGLLADVVREVRPHVVITYEPGGGYGHPDHVQAHRVTMRAVELAAAGPDGAAAAGPAWDVPKLYWVVLPETLVRAAAAELGFDPKGPLPSMVVPDDLVTTVIDASDLTHRKVAALRRHATQVMVTDDGSALIHPHGARQPIVGVEFYRLVRGEPAGERDEAGRETDLFAGLDLTR